MKTARPKVIVKLVVNKFRDMTWRTWGDVAEDHEQAVEFPPEGEDLVRSRDIPGQLTVTVNPS